MDCGSIPEIFQETGHGDFGLVQYQMVYLSEHLIFGREKRTASDNFYAGRPASRNHSFCRFLLDRHRAHKDEISPSQVVVMQAFHIHVDQPFFPLFRKHRCNGQQTEGWTACLSVNEFQSIPETPEGVRKFGINEECFHGTLQSIYVFSSTSKRLFKDLYTPDSPIFIISRFSGTLLFTKSHSYPQYTARRDRRVMKMLAEYHFKIAHGFVWPKVHSSGRT